MKNKSILGGEVHVKVLDDFEISWESDGDYRHWCMMKKVNTNFKKDFLVIMFNPGSLKSDGSNLSRDSTLRMLRKVFSEINRNCLVLNIFDFADPDVNKLIANWRIKDKTSDTIFSHLDKFNIYEYMWAYGDKSFKNAEYQSEFNNRIENIKLKLKPYKEIENLTTDSNNPMHPYCYNFNDNLNKIIKMIRTIEK